MNDLNYPFRTKQEADQYRKKIESKTGMKHKTKKIIFKACIYKVFPIRKTKKTIK